MVEPQATDNKILIAADGIPKPKDHLIFALRAAHFLLLLRKQPERTEFVYRLSLHADLLMRGRLRHTFTYPDTGMPSIEQLRTMPPGSLGRTYFEYTQRNGNSNPNSLNDIKVAAFTANARDVMEAQAWRAADPLLVNQGERISAQHDLWHLLTGYGTTFVDEVCLQAFAYAQTGIGHSFFIGAGGLFNRVLYGDWQGVRKILHAWNRGRQARPMLLLDWKNYWALPIEDVRGILSLKGLEG
jgi:ubiquinone biosynthesis protein Coq4